MTRPPWPVLVVPLLSLVPVPGYSGHTTTPDIVAKTALAAPACLRWMPVGECFWLRCTWLGCTVETSTKVAHFNPDLVVSAYNELGGNPWVEIRATLGLAQQAAATGLLGSLMSVPLDSAGNRTEGAYHARDHRNLVFREADAIGHPVDAVTSMVSGTGLMCQSQTTPFFPYFQSGLDAISWRQEIPEILYPQSWIPGLREIGTWPLQTWGGVYPRTGWTTQAEEPKAAAINAQRAGDIVTRIGEPHIYVPLSATAFMQNDSINIIDHWVTDVFGNLVNQWSPTFTGAKVWPPGPLKEKDASTGDWQMLVPTPEASCSVFGTNDLATVTGWGGGRVDDGGEYAWTLWRPYKCCERRGQTFLTSIDWFPYPP